MFMVPLTTTFWSIMFGSDWPRNATTADPPTHKQTAITLRGVTFSFNNGIEKMKTKTGADWYTAELPATEVPAREKYQVYVDAKMTTPRIEAHFIYIFQPKTPFADIFLPPRFGLKKNCDQANHPSRIKAQPIRVQYESIKLLV